jgi:hypothetical protein
MIRLKFASMIVCISFFGLIPSATAEVKDKNGNVYYPNPNNPKEFCSCQWVGGNPDKLFCKQGCTKATELQIRQSSGAAGSVAARGPSANALSLGKPKAEANCFFPPCTAQPEWPFRGKLVGAAPGTSIQIIDATGVKLSSSQLSTTFEFSMPAPAKPGTAPYRLCATTGGATTCGAPGVIDPEFANTGLGSKGPLRLTPIKMPVDLQRAPR